MIPNYNKKFDSKHFIMPVCCSAKEKGGGTSCCSKSFQAIIQVLGTIDECLDGMPNRDKAPEKVPPHKESPQMKR